MPMPIENELDPQKMEQGKTLAKTLFGFKESNLRKLLEDKKPVLREQFPLLSDDEFHNVIVLALDAKTRQHKMIALQTLPKNLSLILIAALTWLTKDWTIAVILGAFFLISFLLFSGVFKNTKVLPLTIVLGWLSYLAIFAFGYFFYKSGASWNIAILAAAALWAGSLLATWAGNLLLANLLRVSKAS
jgi:hypothetical protein